MSHKELEKNIFKLLDIENQYDTAEFFKHLKSEIANPLLFFFAKLLLSVVEDPNMKQALTNIMNNAKQNIHIPTGFEMS